MKMILDPPYTLHFECETVLTPGGCEDESLPTGKFDMIVTASKTNKPGEGKILININGTEEVAPLVTITEKTDDKVAVTLPSMLLVNAVCITV